MNTRKKKILVEEDFNNRINKKRARFAQRTQQKIILYNSVIIIAIMYKKTTLNNWDFFTALSNRRLNVQTLNTPFKLRWLVDRITLVGELNPKFVSLAGNDGKLRNLNFQDISQLLMTYGFAKEAGIDRFNLVDKFGENIAYVEKVKFYDNKIRLDFNPRKIGSMHDINLKNFIRKLFIKPHFSRADVAVDIFNLPNDFINQYKIVDATSTKVFYDRAGNMETTYWGSSASERQVRLYNKYIEQSHKKQYIDKDISSWWRLEVQLRRSKAEEWNEVVRKTLDSFCSIHFIPNDIKVTDQIMLTGLMNDYSLWGKLARNTKYKYRDMIKKITKNDDLTKELLLSFEEEKNEIKKELNEWLRGIKVAEI